MGKSTFYTKLSDEIIDAKSTEIYFAGGYADLCLQHTFKNFQDILGWTLNDPDLDVTVKTYTSLVFKRKFIETIAKSLCN